MVVDLLDLVECPDGTAKKLTNSILEWLHKSNIETKQVVGFCADTCNVMFGRNKSVSTLLKKEIPSIMAVKCSCHSIHLSSSKASEELPAELEDLIHLIYNHFSNSPKRREEFSEFQDFVDCKKHIILRPGQTRWLSLEYCVRRILEQYKPLVEYFTLVVFEEQDKEIRKRPRKQAPNSALQNQNQANKQELMKSETNACIILKRLQDPLTQVYLEFLKYALKRINEFNTTFQTEIPLLQDLKLSFHGLIKDFANNFMLPDYVRKTEADKINPTL